MLKFTIHRRMSYPCEVTAATYLDTGDDIRLVKDVNKRSSIIGLLVKGLLVQDNTGDVLVQACTSDPLWLDHACLSSFK